MESLGVPGSAIEADIGAGGSMALSPGKAVLVMLLGTPVIAGYIGLAALLGIGAVFAGFIFLMYWTGIKQGTVSEFAPTLVGALGGVALAWMLHAMPAAMGGMGYVLPGVLLFVAILCLMCQWLPIIFNLSFMLMLTVGGIPSVAAAEPFLGMCAAILLSAAYFGALMLGLAKLGLGGGTATAKA